MSLELAGEMRRGSADFMVGRSVSGCNKPGYKAATHPVMVGTYEKPSQTGGVHITMNMTDATPIYGEYDLKRNDHDGQTGSVPPRWGGTDNPTPPAMSAQTPPGGVTLGVPAWVHMLQDDLRTLGFTIVPALTGKFDLYTEWAVKEFQCHASLAKVAKINTDRLSQYATQAGLSEHGVSAPDVMSLGMRPDSDPPESYYAGVLNSVDNAARYTGPISGVANEETRKAIEYWLEHDYRCPVVIEECFTGIFPGITPIRLSLSKIRTNIMCWAITLFMAPVPALKASHPSSRGRRQR